jgi:hypothetical protein
MRSADHGGKLTLGSAPTPVNAGTAHTEGRPTARASQRRITRLASRPRRRAPIAWSPPAPATTPRRSGRAQRGCVRCRRAFALHRPGYSRARRGSRRHWERGSLQARRRDHHGPGVPGRVMGLNRPRDEVRSVVIWRVPHDRCRSFAPNRPPGASANDLRPCDRCPAQPANCARGVARGWVTSPGRRVAFAEGEVRDAAGRPSQPRPEPAW